METLQQDHLGGPRLLPEGPAIDVEALIADHLFLVDNKTQSFLGKGVDENCIRSAALEGLWSAARRWDGFSCSFNTLAHRFIAYSVQDYLRVALGRRESHQAEIALEMHALQLDEEVEDGISLAESIPDAQAPMPFAGLVDAERIRLAHELLAAAPLTDNEDIALRWYFFENATMQTIGNAFGLTESRVSQMVASALRKLRSVSDGSDGR